jgi:hypothetical protein
MLLSESRWRQAFGTAKRGSPQTNEMYSRSSCPRRIIRAGLLCRVDTARPLRSLDRKAVLRAAGPLSIAARRKSDRLGGTGKWVRKRLRRPSVVRQEPATASIIRLIELPRPARGAIPEFHPTPGKRR